MDLYDIARQVTDEVLGDGTYAEVNAGNPNPQVQAAIKRGKAEDAELVHVPADGRSNEGPRGEA